MTNYKKGGSINVIPSSSTPVHPRQCPQIGRQHGIKNMAAIAFQCKLNVKLIAALLFIPYRLPILGDHLCTNNICNTEPM